MRLASLDTTIDKLMLILGKLMDINELPYPRPLSGEPVTELPTALVPSRAIITGRYVELMPQNATEHAAELFEAGHSSADALSIWDYMNYGPWPSVAAYEATLRTQSSSFDTIFFSIRSLETGEISGQASFLDINPQMGVIEIGHIWFGPALQRTRAATEALYLMIKYAMDDLKYRRMEWRCNAQNNKSRLAANRLGYRFEGIFYNHMISKGKNRDTAWYSILDDEWPEVKSIIESWLSESNFDETGNAKTSLRQQMQSRTPSSRGQ